MFTQIVSYKLSYKLKQIGNVFFSSGFSCFLVGGAVRDIINGLPPVDYDLATNATPEQVKGLFNRVIPTGIKHGTVTVLFKNNRFEVTTFRIDGIYSDKRQPDSITFTPSIYEDLKRRDFTINSMAIDLSTGELLDPHNGISDLKNKIIKAIGNPQERFSEDGLRLLRACRFSSQLNFQIEDNTFEAIIISNNYIRNVSPERIREELEKILKTDKPSISLFLLDKTHLLDIIFPELCKCRGVEQKGYHNFDVLTHSILSCDAAPKDNIVVRLSALFHDIGKPAVAQYSSENEPTFYRHEDKSAEITRDILKRLRFSKRIEEKVCHLINNHMFHYTDSWSDSAVRRFISRVGKQNIDDLFLLRIADQYGMQCDYILSQNLKVFENHIKKVLEQEHTLSIQDLDIDGNELHSLAGIPKSPVMGLVLNALLESVLDDPSQMKNKHLLRLPGIITKLIFCNLIPSIRSTLFFFV